MKKSNLIGFIGNLLLLVALHVYNDTRTNTSTSTDQVVYACIGIFALLCILAFSVPSFKKSDYPNILGLLGLILGIVTVNMAVFVLFPL
jgi:cell division protein FtsW (lipid II flippase)